MNTPLFQFVVWTTTLINVFFDTPLARSECVPPTRSYIFFDTNGFVAHKSPDGSSDKNDFAIQGPDVTKMIGGTPTGPALFAAAGVRRDKANWIIEIVVDDDVRFVVVPETRLHEVRFIVDEKEFSQSMDSDNLLGFTAAVIGVLPCVRQARSEYIENLFHDAFEALRTGELEVARSLFYAGLSMNPLNATAMFWYAEAMSLSGYDSDESKVERLREAYGHARKLGLPEDLSALAEAQMARLDAKIKN